MHLESFHRLLKVVYLQGKQNRRLDHLLSILLKIARDKGFERLQKLHKGKVSHRSCELNRRHKKAEEMVSSRLTPILLSDDTWQVESQSNPLACYVVQSQPHHQCDCKLLCSACKVCVCAYTCTCIDYAIHSTACKHIHFLHMKSSSKPDHLPTSDALQSPTQVSGEMLEHITQNTHTTRVRNLQQCVISRDNEIITLASSTETAHALETAAKHLSNSIMQCNVSSEYTSPTADNTVSKEASSKKKEWKLKFVFTLRIKRQKSQPAFQNHL